MTRMLVKMSIVCQGQVLALLDQPGFIPKENEDVTITLDGGTVTTRRVISVNHRFVPPTQHPWAPLQVITLDVGLESKHK